MGEDYLRLLASFEVALPLEQRSGFVEPALALKILSLSEGTIGEISALLCRAALDAIERGAEQITGQSLDRCGYVAPSQRRRAAIGAYFRLWVTLQIRVLAISALSGTGCEHRGSKRKNFPVFDNRQGDVAINRTAVSA
jgi:hypothetical protein